jgi:hypothetical protein
MECRKGGDDTTGGEARIGCGSPLSTEVPSVKEGP